MESRSDETTGRLPPNIRARSAGALATERRPTECDALCIWCFCGDSQYPQLINNKKTRARPGSERRFAPGFASRCARLLRRGSPVLGASRLRLLRPHRRPCLSVYAASLTLRRSGLHFLFVLYRWLRGYAAPPPATVFRPLRGSNLGSPAARNLFFNFRFIALR